MQYQAITLSVLTILILVCGGSSAVFALTPEEVLALKKAGVGDETIRVMMQQEREGMASAKGPAMGKREIRDSRGDVSIEYSTGPGKSSGVSDVEKQKADRAWEMLPHLIVDSRKKK